MNRVEKIENQIEELSRDELTALRQWFAGFDADAWDRQMGADINAAGWTALQSGRFSIMKPA